MGDPAELEPWKLNGDWPQAAIYDLAIDRAVVVIRGFAYDPLAERIASDVLKLKFVKDKS
jgi:hypothetical protein